MESDECPGYGRRAGGGARIRRHLPLVEDRWPGDVDAPGGRIESIGQRPHVRDIVDEAKVFPVQLHICLERLVHLNGELAEALGPIERGTTFQQRRPHCVNRAPGKQVVAADVIEMVMSVYDMRLG
jgi:hypothetical protein